VDLDVSFTLEGGPPDVTGEISLKSTLTASPESGEYQAKALELEADLKGAQLPGGQAKFSLSADVGVNLTEQTAKFENLVIKLLGLEVAGALAIANLSSNPQLGGNLAIANFNPKKLLEQLGQSPIETTDPKALTSLSVQTKVGGNAANISLSDLVVKLDDSALQGSAAYGSGISFDLDVDGIDADRYLPPSGATDTASSESSADEADIPVEALRALDVNGKFRLGKLKISNLNLTDISLKVKAKDGLINLNPIAAKLYDGSYAGNIVLDARGDTPKLAVDEKLSGVQIGPLLVDLNGEEPLSGVGNVQAKLTAVGANPQAMKKTLNGSAAFSFTDGTLNGINIGEMIRNAQASILGGSADAKGPRKTDFAELGGTAQIKNGLVTNNDFAAKSPLLRIEGKGTADLPTEALDYRVKTTLVATVEGQGGGELVDLTGIAIPVRVTGTFSKPSYGVDMEALAGIIAKSKTEDLLTGDVGDLTESAGELIKGGAEGVGEVLKGSAEGVGNLLEGLLGN
jgi:AsmA protein